MSIPSEAKTASKASVNLASRSRIRKRNALSWSSRSISRVRAAWVVQAVVGWAVTPEEMNLPGVHLDDEQDGETAQSDGVEGEKVGGHKPGGLGAGGRSAIRCLLGVVPGRAGLRGRIGRMVPVPPRYPSPASSPWIRRWPQEGFSWARRSTNLRISPVIGGRPDRWG